MSVVDVAVIGAGLAGSAVARELARRGASVVLVEREDLAHAGSVAGQGTIDASELTLGAKTDAAPRARRERETTILTKLAPHLCAVVPVLAVLDGPERGARLLARWDALHALLARGGERIGSGVLDARAASGREPALALDDDRGALLAQRLRMDAQRLALAYVRDAAENGADLLRDEIVGIARDESGVRLSRRGGDPLRARAAVVATGAAPVPGAATAPARERRVHLVVGHSITTHAVVAGDVSVVPFHNVTVVSGAARSEDGEGGARATRDEVRALLASAARVVPALREARVDAAYASLRRVGAHRVEAPVFALAPGSPWDARVRGGDVGQAVARRLGLAPSRDVDTAVLPGGEEVVDSFLVAERLAIPEPTARRVALRHGARAIDVGARITKRRTEAAVVCACEPVLEAEVRHAVRVEHATDVSSVCRRTGLGRGPCGGMRCAQRAAEIVADERALSPRHARDMARRFLAERWAERAPALDPTTLAQEELAHARWAAASLGVDVAEET